MDGDGNTEYEFVDFHDLGLDVGDRVQPLGWHSVLGVDSCPKG